MPVLRYPRRSRSFRLTPASAAARLFCLQLDARLLAALSRQGARTPPAPHVRPLRQDLCGDRDKGCRMRSRIVRSGAVIVRLAGRGLAILIAIIGLSYAANAGEEDFYRGKQIRLIISSGPAGVYDTYGRLLARFLPAHLPGRPTIIVQNMPGASG